MDSLSMSFKTFQGTVDVTQCLQCSPVSLDMINHLSKAPWISWTPYFQDLKGVFCFLLELILILSNKALLVLLVSVSVSFKEMINRPISEVYEMELGNYFLSGKIKETWRFGGGKSIQNSSNPCGISHRKPVPQHWLHYRSSVASL